MSITSKAVRAGIKESRRLILDWAHSIRLDREGSHVTKQGGPPYTSRSLASLNQKLAPRSFIRINTICHCLDCFLGFFVSISYSITRKQVYNAHLFDHHLKSLALRFDTISLPL